MIIVMVFVSALVVIAVWYLAGQNLAAKPWLEQGVIGDLRDADEGRPNLAKIGLGVFLAVAGMLFALLASAYVMRAVSPDWQNTPLPRVLWFNTGVLVLSSAALQAAVFFADRQDAHRVRFCLMAGALTAMVFLAGQLAAWREFAREGYFLSTNPANSFFYLLTGVHGAHLLGGLVALAAANIVASRSGIRLCAIYWHFLLVVWLLLFALLAGWAGGFVLICRGLVT